MLTHLWNLILDKAEKVLKTIDDYSSRDQAFRIVDDGGVTIYYAPYKIDRDEWQAMLATKLGAEGRTPQDIGKMHMACVLHAMKLVDDEGHAPGKVVSILSRIDIVPENIMPDFLGGNVRDPATVISLDAPKTKIPTQDLS